MAKYQTRRQSLIELYSSKPQDFIVATKPYHSTVCLAFECVDLDATNQYGYAVARKGVTLDFFSYGIGDNNVPFGPTARKATDADTNISKGKNTNGASDFVVEGISFSSRGLRYQQRPAGNGFVVVPGATDPDVVAMLAGSRLVADPASIVTPPQVYSPFNLENVFMNAILGSMSCQLAWDEDRTEKIGHVLSLPQGGGGSELRSNGLPLSSNVFKIEEGYLWAKSSEQDSELVFRCTLQESIVIPITLNDNPANAAETIAPTAIYIDLVAKLHGFEFKYPSRN